VRLLHAVAFSKKLHWLAQTKKITLKIQHHAANAGLKHLSQRSLKHKREKENKFFTE
jgi:hypothetical protein